jgi:hypothetical protein
MTIQSQEEYARMKAEYVRQKKKIATHYLNLQENGYSKEEADRLCEPMECFNANLADDLREWELKQKGEGK